MYHLPSEEKVKEIVVTKEMIERKVAVFVADTDALPILVNLILKSTYADALA